MSALVSAVSMLSAYEPCIFFHYFRMSTWHNNECSFNCSLPAGVGCVILGSWQPLLAVSADNIALQLTAIVGSVSRQCCLAADSHCWQCQPTMLPCSWQPLKAVSADNVALAADSHCWQCQPTMLPWQLTAIVDSVSRQCCLVWCNFLSCRIGCKAITNWVFLGVYTRRNNIFKNSRVEFNNWLHSNI